MNNNDKDILTANEFAKCVGIHYNTVRKMIKTGRINAFKIGCGGKTSDIRIPRSEIQRLALADLGSIVNDIVEKRIQEKSAKVKRRFFSKIEKINSCWVWKGAKSKSGYGIFSYKCKYIRAHRASYIIHKGEIPDEMLVLHSCDVRDCVNPDHLHLGTPQQNMDERKERKRFISKKGQDHHCCKFSDDQINDIVNLRKQKVPAKEIAKKYKISYDYVYQIAAGIYRKKE